MAGGDILYIFAFIILPTAVLVSCIWALILLRKGVLLPERPVPQHERDMVGNNEVHEPDLVEETGEHVLVEPAVRQASAPASTTQRDVPPPVVQPEPVANVTAAEPGADAVPTPQQTQEMAAVPVAVVPDVADPKVPEHSEPQVADAVPAPQPVQDPADVLLVPLDEPVPAPSPNGRVPAPAASVGPPPEDARGNAENDANDESAAQVPASGARRPARRIAQPRPAGTDSARPRPRAGQRRANRGGEGE